MLFLQNGHTLKVNKVYFGQWLWRIMWSDFLYSGHVKPNLHNFHAVNKLSDAYFSES